MPDKNGFISGSHVPVGSLHENVSQVVIVTTEDRLRNILNDYERTLDNKKPWIAVMSVFLTLVTTLVTSEPTNFLLSKEVWRIVFGGATVAAFFWLASCATKAVAAWRHPMSIEDIVRRAKASPQ